MKMQAIQCPCCGGSLNVVLKPDTQVTCPRCGSAILLQDDTQRQVYTYNINSHVTDDAQIARAETDKAVEIEKQKTERVEMILGFGFLFFMFVLCYFMMGCAN